MKLRQMAGLAGAAAFLLGGPLRAEVEIAYPQAAAPGEAIPFRIQGGAADAPVVVTAGDAAASLPPEGGEVRIVAVGRAPGIVPVRATVGAGPPIDLPAIALVPEEGEYGRGTVSSPLRALRRPVLRVDGDTAPLQRRPLPVLLDAGEGARYFVDGFAAAADGPVVDGAWPGPDGHFVRAAAAGAQGTAWSDPVWIAPFRERGETVADYRPDPESQAWVDRWGRFPSLPGAVAKAVSPGVATGGGGPLRCGVADLPPGPLTLVFLVRPDALPSRAVLRGSSVLAVSLEGASLVLARPGEDRGAVRLVATRPLAAGRWQCVSGVFDGGTLRLFLDGLPAGETPCAGRRSALGAETLLAAGDGASPFAGRLAAYAVYDRALSGEEEKALADSYLALFPPHAP